MVENGMIPGTPETSMKPLMATLYAQQDLLQQLYTELDVEREASATATNESLAMILRLQGEKAAVEMEASQYKRIAEEKMFHAQETLETFRDLIYQKEMHIASLEFQVQAYRFKLVSLGCKDVGENDSTYPVNIISRTNTLLGGQGFVQRTMRRGCSLPPNLTKDGDEPSVDGNACSDHEGSLMVLPETANLDSGHSKSGDFSSYWQQIKRLDERVKELSISKDTFDGSSKLNDVSKSYCLDMEPSGDSAAPSKIHDVFEVPQADNHDEFADLSKVEDKGEVSSEYEIRPVNHDSVKTVISGVTDRSNWNQRMPMSSDVAEQLSFKRPDVTDFELQQMNRRLRRLEDERIMGRQEIAFEEDDEKVMLLKAIKDQLDSIEDEIMSQRPKKPPPEKHVDVTSLTEAMLHFWL